MINCGSIYNISCFIIFYFFHTTFHWEVVYRISPENKLIVSLMCLGYVWTFFFYFNNSCLTKIYARKYLKI